QPTNVSPALRGASASSPKGPGPPAEIISRSVPMPSIETYRKQAKLLVRWHRERNYSVGGKVRLLERYRHLTDVEVLKMAMPLTLAQEVVAVEAGFKDWAALKAAPGDLIPPSHVDTSEPTLLGAVPILFVCNVEAAAIFYEETLGFGVDFLHG